MSEAERAGAVIREPLQRSIIARPIPGGAVHTIIGPEPAQRGPWSFITDTPHPTQDMVGPPAPYLAIAAWAAWTVVTVVGVAHRGQIPLLAASTVTTLRQCISNEAWSSAGFHVEMIPQGAGNRDQSQAAAAAGAVNTRLVVRKIVLYGALAASSVRAIEATLQHDPLALSFRSGGVLLGEQIMVT